MKSVRILINSQAEVIPGFLNAWISIVSQTKGVKWETKVFDPNAPDMLQFENEMIVVEVELDGGYKYLNTTTQYEHIFN